MVREMRSLRVRREGTDLGGVWLVDNVLELVVHVYMSRYFCDDNMTLFSSLLVFELR